MTTADTKRVRMRERQSNTSSKSSYLYSQRKGYARSNFQMIGLAGICVPRCENDTILDIVYWAPNKSMIGTDPGIALNAKSDAMAIIAARPF
jgi:hypothetical protein